MKLMIGLTAGMTAGSAAAVVLTNPGVLSAAGEALATGDPEAGAQAAAAVASVAQEAWPFYVGAGLVALAWQGSRPLMEAAREWLIHLADRHHAREVRRQQLSRLVRRKPPPAPSGDGDDGRPA